MAEWIAKTIKDLLIEIEQKKFVGNLPRRHALIARQQSENQVSSRCPEECGGRLMLSGGRKAEGDRADS